MMPVLVLPRFPTALFSVLEEPGVPAGPRLLPLVPWLFALLAFAPGAPPVPFAVAPVVSIVADPDDEPPVEVPGEPPAELADPPAAPPADPPPPPPPPPPLCARADKGDSSAAMRSILPESEEDMDRTPFPRQRRVKQRVPKSRKHPLPAVRVPISTGDVICRPATAALRCANATRPLDPDKVHPWDEHREKVAQAYFARYAKDRYQTEVESWADIQCHNIEFTMKRPQSRRIEGKKDYKASLEKFRKDAAKNRLISDLARDNTKREMFAKWPSPESAGGRSQSAMTTRQIEEDW
jgi:hypothetical protein